MASAAKVIDARVDLSGSRRKGAIRDLMAVINKYDLDYTEFVQLSKIARDELNLKRPKTYKTVKPIPNGDELKRFMAVVEKQSLMHQIMIKLLLYMGIRSDEVIGIKVEDLDLSYDKARILMLKRKAGRDKTMTIPAKLATLIRAYVDSIPKNIWLFEPPYKEGMPRHRPFSDPRFLRAYIQKWRKEAGVGDVMHAHNLRHLLLTYLAELGWTEHELKLVSGHDSSTSLERYLHRNPETVRQSLDKAINNMGV